MTTEWNQAAAVQEYISYFKQLKEQGTARVELLQEAKRLKASPWNPDTPHAAQYFQSLPPPSSAHSQNASQGAETYPPDKADVLLRVLKQEIDANTKVQEAMTASRILNFALHAKQLVAFDDAAYKHVSIQAECGKSVSARLITREFVYPECNMNVPDNSVEISIPSITITKGNDNYFITLQPAGGDGDGLYHFSLNIIIYAFNCTTIFCKHFKSSLQVRNKAFQVIWS